jgi:hypothetical protein
MAARLLALTVLLVVGVTSAVSAASNPAGYLPVTTVKQAVFAHLTSQKLGVTYSQTTTKLYTDLNIADTNFGMFDLFITAKGVPVHRFAAKSGPYYVRYPAKRRVIAASNVYSNALGTFCQLVEVYGLNVALQYTADAPGRRCPATNPPGAFHRLDQILRALPGA